MYGKKLSKLVKTGKLHGFVFISPWLIGFLAFQLIPILLVFYYSFTNYSLGTQYDWVGLQNYIRAFNKDDLFWKSLGNTFYYIGISVPLVIVFSFIVANMLNVKMRGTAIYRVLVYLPTIVPLAASSMVWLWLLDSRLGLINSVISVIGISPVRWLTDPAWSKPSLILMRLWIIGGPAIIFLANLQGIPKSLYESAEIDGAGPIRRILSITVPLMTPSILYNLVINMIFAFQIFTQSFIITQGGPVNSTLFYMLHLYREGFQFLKLGYASMLGVVLFVIILILTLITFATSRRWVYYDYEAK
jgi:multiple sugar transport system permease protein